MVKVRDFSPLDKDWNIEAWLAHLAQKGYQAHVPTIRQAVSFSQLLGAEHAMETGVSAFQHGLAMADVLADLAVDSETVIAALVYASIVYADFPLDEAALQLSPTVIKLVAGVKKMAILSQVGGVKHPSQIDKMRKMFLAVVDDVRVVLIKLVDRLCILREQAHLPNAMQQQFAREAMDIYAPLANRLGIGALKWELEDLAFRYLEPAAYHEVAAGLKAKRLEREAFVEEIVNKLNAALTQEGIRHFKIYGRAKHIHSIYRKMLRKNVPLTEVYDAIAIRVLVDNKEDCYQVLSMVHSLFEPVASEFDDYIAKPKKNGYQSLHTAVKASNGRVFEVQIRTHEMHALAEMGVAAHWKYKEGAQTEASSHEKKIAWLREVLAWQREISETLSDNLESVTPYLEERIYVLTPQGEIVDLPREATVLDFAYHVHTQLGHCCRGAKVDGRMVPLTHVLETGNRVEILAAKVEKPSRDWLNPHLHYLNTVRARAKVHHWFRIQDSDMHKAQGHALLEKELKILHVKLSTVEDNLALLHYKSLDELYIAIGRGDAKPAHIVARLPHTAPLVSVIAPVTFKRETSSGELHVEGVGRLLTKKAKCCKPLPGDEVVGYITIGQGVSIHKQDCPNIIHATEKQRQRLLKVTWGKQAEEHYEVHLLLKAYNRYDLLKDITAVLSAEKSHIYGIQARKEDAVLLVDMTIDVAGVAGLSRLVAKLGQVENVFEVKRKVD